MGNAEATPADNTDKVDEVESAGWFSRVWQWIRSGIDMVIDAVVGAPSEMIDLGARAVQTVATTAVAILPAGIITVPMAVLIALGLGSIEAIRAILRYFRHPERVVSGITDVGVSVAETVVNITTAIIRPASVVITPGLRLLFWVIRAISGYIREQEENGCLPSFNGNRYLQGS